MARPLDFRSSEGLERTMRSLLRTPKTRSGLFAVAKKHGVGRNWVYGWVANAEASIERPLPSVPRTDTRSTNRASSSGTRRCRQIVIAARPSFGIA